MNVKEEAQLTLLENLMLTNIKERNLFNTSNIMKSSIRLCNNTNRDSRFVVLHNIVTTYFKVSMELFRKSDLSPERVNRIIRFLKRLITNKVTNVEGILLELGLFLISQNLLDNAKTSLGEALTTYNDNATMKDIYFMTIIMKLIALKNKMFDTELSDEDKGKVNESAKELLTEADMKLKEYYEVTPPPISYLSSLINIRLCKQLPFIHQDQVDTSYEQIEEFIKKDPDNPDGHRLRIKFLEEYPHHLKRSLSKKIMLESMRNILLSDPVADVAEYFFTAYCNGKCKSIIQPKAMCELLKQGVEYFYKDPQAWERFNIFLLNYDKIHLILDDIKWWPQYFFQRETIPSEYLIGLLPAKASCFLLLYPSIKRGYVFEVLTYLKENSPIIYKELIKDLTKPHNKDIRQFI